MYRSIRIGVAFHFIVLLIILTMITVIDVDAAKDTGLCKTNITNKIEIKATSLNPGTDRTITIKLPNEGSYELQYNIVDYGEDAKDIIDDDGNTKNLHKETISDGKTINLSKGKEIFILVGLKENYTITSGKKSQTCHAPGNLSTKKNGEIKNQGTWKSRFIQNPDSSDIDNPIFDSLGCDNMRKGIYKNDGTRSDEDATTTNDDVSWQNYASKYFPYCFKADKKMKFTLSQKNVNYVRKELINIYKQKIQIKTGKIVPTEGFTKKVESTDVGKLTCNSSPQKGSDGKDLNNNNKYYYEESTPIKNSKNNETICTVTCREELEVIYSPPVAVKAGLCFQYEVTVKSKVQCETELNSDAVPTPPTDFCAPYPICEAGTDQAGPNDDFDDCINACDGGKYSQNCINQCYNKVYKKSNTTNSVKKVSVKTQQSFDYNIVPLADKEDDPYDIDGCKTNSQIMNNLDYCAEKLMEVKQATPLGHYDYKNNLDIGTFVWSSSYKEPPIKDTSKPGSVESFVNSIKRSSPYYLRNLNATKDLIKSLNGYYTDRYKRYIIDKNGIKRQWSWRYQCGEDCGYKGCKEGSIYNNEKASKEYEKSLKGYADALSQCNAAAKCSTNEATFTIDVTNDRDTNNDNSCDTHDETDERYYHAWNAKNTKNQLGGLPNGDTLIFTPVKGDSSDVNKGINGICYGKKMPWQHYKTTITFPGSWINLKTGEVEFVDPNKNNEYRTKENYFCTLYDSCNVNVDWWNWKINGTSLSNFNPTYNINSSIKDFGKYNWNISLQCFYALYNRTGPITSSKCYRGDPGTEELCSDTPEGSKDESTKLNYDIRVASLDNMFPNNRLRGYNWGAAAQLKADPNDSVLKQKLSENGYDINPVDYSREIIGSQNGKGEEKTYKETPDLIVNLSSDNISSLKQESLNFGGEFNKTKEIIPGLYAYEMKGFKDKYGITTNWTIGKNNG